MVNLRAFANNYTRVINPNVVCTLKRSTGQTTADTGKRTPTYVDVTDVVVQAQALSFKDISQLDGLNIQGTRRAIYANVQVMEIVRVQKLGGDLLVFAAGVFPEGRTWLAAHVLERWPDWCKVAITLQNDLPA